MSGEYLVCNLHQTKKRKKKKKKQRRVILEDSDEDDDDIIEEEEEEVRVANGGGNNEENAAGSTSSASMEDTTSMEATRPLMVALVHGNATTTKTKKSKNDKKREGVVALPKQSKEDCGEGNKSLIEEGSRQASLDMEVEERAALGLVNQRHICRNEEENAGSRLTTASTEEDTSLQPTESLMVADGCNAATMTTEEKMKREAMMKEIAVLKNQEGKKKNASDGEENHPQEEEEGTMEKKMKKKKDGRSDLNSSISSEPRFPVGTKFWKNFGYDVGKYMGQITSFDGNHYRVLYPEDNDREDLSEYEFYGSDIEVIMEEHEARNDAKKQKKKRINAVLGGDTWEEEEQDDHSQISSKKKNTKRKRKLATTTEEAENEIVDNPPKVKKKKKKKERAVSQTESDGQLDESSNKPSNLISAGGVVEDEGYSPNYDRQENPKVKQKKKRKVANETIAPAGNEGKEFMIDDHSASVVDNPVQNDYEGCSESSKSKKKKKRKSAEFVPVEDEFDCDSNNRSTSDSKSRNPLWDDDEVLKRNRKKKKRKRKKGSSESMTAEKESKNSEEQEVGSTKRDAICSDESNSTKKDTRQAQEQQQSETDSRILIEIQQPLHLNGQEDEEITSEQEQQPTGKEAPRTAATDNAKPKRPLTWDESFEELKAYVEENGHANVPAKYPRLGMWVVNQRGPFKHRLTDAQIEKLDSIGFNWETQQERFERQWNEMLQRYKEYVRARIGISVCEPGFFHDDQTLKGWVEYQQTKYRNGTIKEDRKKRLEEVGFAWVRDERYVGLVKDSKKLDEKWETMLEKLMLFRDKEGHTMVQPDHPDESLHKWVHRQRVFRRDGTLRADRQAKLEEIGFVWDMTDHCDAETSLKQRHWDHMYDRLKAFYDKNGHTRCGKTHDDRELANWVSIQREKYASNSLDERRARRLEALNFSANLAEDQWNAMYKELELYHQKHGHANVPYDESSRLARWVAHQRSADSNLSKQRREKLNKLGFVWDARKEKWYIMCDRLVTWKLEHGHCNVPDQYEPDPELGNWVKTQRSLVRGSKSGGLAPEKKKLLDDLGFVWQGIENWNEKYERLKVYFEKHKHSNVPFYDRELGRWVSYQRKKKAEGTLAPEKEAKLNKLNFSWETEAESKERGWDESFGKLEKYMKQHNITTAPQWIRGDKTLAKWVARQRQWNKKGTLREDRKAKLESIGFVWVAKETYS